MAGCNGLNTSPVKDWPVSYLFPLIVSLLLGISFLKNRQKSLQALRLALRRFTAILPLFTIVILLTSLVLGFVSESTIRQAMGTPANRWNASGISALLGSVAIMPGFVAFPLGAILRDSGVLYMVVSAFTTTLMMVGVVTFPIERAFLGTRVAIVRNLIGLAIALIVAVCTGFAFGEVFR
jgi:uncharacterized membrane protein YraQ (UPF0718 family)